jgi:hypothetical protein
MTSRQRALLLILVIPVGALAPGCESAPAAPTITPAVFVPPVPTLRPYTWDTADELSAWINGVSAGSFAIAGQGTDAVIQIDMAASNANLHGPDCDPLVRDAQAARVRYRWVGRQSGEAVDLRLFLRPIEFDRNATLPILAPAGPVSVVEEHAGAWVERQFVSSGSVKPPFSVRFVTTTITGHGSGGLRIHGTIEIDWIALVR